MSRTTRVAAMAGAGALAASLAFPGPALAEDAAPIFARAASALERSTIDNPAFAGYISELGRKKTIVGTFTVPTLNCGRVDEGIFTLIELSANGGEDYVDGGVFSSCVDRVATHNPAFDTTTDELQVPIDEVVKNGDKIKVINEVVRGNIKVTMRNLTRDWTAKHTFDAFTPDEASVLQYRITVGGAEVEPLRKDCAVKDVKIGGKDLKATNPTKYILVDNAEDPLIRPAAIKKGTDFKFDYVG